MMFNLVRPIRSMDTMTKVSPLPGGGSGRGNRGGSKLQSTERGRVRGLLKGQKGAPLNLG